VVIAGALVTVVVILFFLLLFWNRFLGLRSGDGCFSGGLGILAGGIPYRDGYSPGPPLFSVRTAAVFAVFGKTMIALRGAGVFERLLLSLLLYGWLARFFKARNAALAAIVTMVVSTGDLSDPLSSYNHFAILLAMVSGMVSSYALDENRTLRGLVSLGSVAGIFSFLCLACKQTIGLGITVAVPVVIGACLIRLEGTRKAAAYLCGFAAGWFVPVALLCAWFIRLGILRTFLQQIFVTGPAAKASHPVDFLTRAIYIMSMMKWEAAIGVAALLLCWGSVHRTSTTEPEPEDASPASMLSIFGVLLLGVSAIGFSLKVPSHFLEAHLSISPYQLIFYSFHAMKPLIYLALLGSGSLIIWYFCIYLRKSLSRRQSQFLLFTAVSFSVAFMLSLSSPAFEAMIVPALGLFLAALLEDVTDWRRWAIYAICGGLIFCEIQVKMFIPFEFSGWREPSVASATESSTLPELKGMLLPANTVNFVDTTVHLIQENSSPSDTIFVYPELSFLYAASHRGAATFSGSHNIDVVPDSFAREDAARLLIRRPAVLIYGVESEGFLLAQERMWRNGQRSGQRELIAAVQTLAAQYHLAATFDLYPGHLVYVFVRPR
jgi:hypothetical protein